MIVPMRKYSFLVYHKNYLEFLEAIREIGVLHVIEKQASHQIRCGQGTAGVAAAGIGGHVDNVPPDLLAHAGKLCRIHEKPPYKVFTCVSV